jgi:hypothetical protein
MLGLQKGTSKQAACSTEKGGSFLILTFDQGAESAQGHFFRSFLFKKRQIVFSGRDKANVAMGRPSVSADRNRTDVNRSHEAEQGENYHACKSEHG